MALKTLSRVSGLTLPAPLMTLETVITDTPALRVIPGHEQMIEFARRRNPFHRLTSPDDVAHAIAELSRPGLAWMTGNVIRIDGGEFIVP